MTSIGSNPNQIFQRNWQFENGRNELDISSQAKDCVLHEADADGNGSLSMQEARDYLVVNNKVRQDGQAVDFKAALNHIFAAKNGRVMDVLDATLTTRSHYLYLQFNNRQDKRLVEETPIEQAAKRDDTKPAVDRINLTTQFNTNGDEGEATRAFKDSMRSYMDALIKDGHDMSGFIISGHSDGTYLLQEADDHYYYSNLHIRQALRELRNESSEYAQLMDGTDAVGLLACFQGGSISEWQEIFPNAVIAGTTKFAPAAATYASGNIFKAALERNEVLEGGKSTGFKVGADLHRRGLRVEDPLDQSSAMASSRALYNKAKVAYDALHDELKNIRDKEGRDYSQEELRKAYTVAMTYANAYRSLWVAEGRPGGEDGQRAHNVAQLLYEARDLFAIRMHLLRPSPPDFNDASSMDEELDDFSAGIDGSELAQQLIDENLGYSWNDWAITNENAVSTLRQLESIAYDQEQLKQALTLLKDGNFNISVAGSVRAGGIEYIDYVARLHANLPEQSQKQQLESLCKLVGITVQ